MVDAHCLPTKRKGVYFEGNLREVVWKFILMLEDATPRTGRAGNGAENAEIARRLLRLISAATGLGFS